MKMNKKEKTQQEALKLRKKEEELFRFQDAVAELEDAFKGEIEEVIAAHIPVLSPHQVIGVMQCIIVELAASRKTSE